MATTDGSRDRPGPAGRQVSGGYVVAVVKDLFFLARIRETGRLAGVPVVFAKTPEELQGALGGEVRLVLLDLTGGLDYERVLTTLASRPAPVLGFTTHALARETSPWHGRCDRVVTKEALTRELPSLLTAGLTPEGRRLDPMEGVTP
jgi:hypothetical protein